MNDVSTHILNSRVHNAHILMKNSYCRFKSTQNNEDMLANSSTATKLLKPPDKQKVILNGKITSMKHFRKDAYLATTRESWKNQLSIKSYLTI